MKSKLFLTVLLLAAITTIGISQKKKASAVERGDKAVREESMRWGAALREKRSKEKAEEELIAALPFDLANLVGVKGIWVCGPYLQRNDKSAGLTADQIKKDVELELRLAGIKVNSPEECVASAEEAWLHVKVETNHEKDSQYIGHYVSLRFNQEVILVRNPHARVGAATWQTGVLGRSTKSEFAQAVRNDVRLYVSMFIDNYAIANPKK